MTIRCKNSLGINERKSNLSALSLNPHVLDELMLEEHHSSNEYESSEAILGRGDYKVRDHFQKYPQGLTQKLGDFMPEL